MALAAPTFGYPLQQIQLDSSFVMCWVVFLQWESWSWKEAAELHCSQWWILLKCIFLQSSIYKPLSYDFSSGSYCRSMLVLWETGLSSPDAPFLCWDLIPTNFPFLKQRVKGYDGSHKSTPSHLFGLCLDKQHFTSYYIVCTSSDPCSVSAIWLDTGALLWPCSTFSWALQYWGLSSCREVEREKKKQRWVGWPEDGRWLFTRNVKGIKVCDCDGLANF